MCCRKTEGFFVLTFFFLTKQHQSHDLTVTWCCDLHMLLPRDFRGDHACMLSACPAIQLNLHVRGNYHWISLTELKWYVHGKTVKLILCPQPNRMNGNSSRFSMRECICISRVFIARDRTIIPRTYISNCTYSFRLHFCSWIYVYELQDTTTKNSWFISVHPSKQIPLELPFFSCFFQTVTWSSTPIAESSAQHYCLAEHNPAELAADRIMKEKN